MYLKKCLALLVSAALVLTLLAGCGTLHSRKIASALNAIQKILQVETSDELDNALRQAVQAGGDLTTLTLPLAGLMWGLGDALATATMSILPVKVMGRYGNFTVNGLMFLISGVILCAVVRPWAHAPQLDALGIALMVFTVVGGTFGAYWLYMSGVMRIGAMRATMLGTSEPVLATISAVALTGAVFTPVDLVGFAMILAMVFLVR